MLVAAGFVDVAVVVKTSSAAFISEWLPGSGESNQSNQIQHTRLVGVCELSFGGNINASA